MSEVLLDFSYEKIDNEKDWDIQKELEEFIYILNNETNHIPAKDLKNKNLVGADVVELAPDIDSTGNSSVFAAKVVRELVLCMRSKND